MAEEYYTDNPLDDEAAIKEMEFSLGGMLADKPVSAIDADANFSIPAGVYDAYIKRIGINLNKETHSREHFVKVFVDDEETSFVTTRVEVDFALLFKDEETGKSHPILKGDGEPLYIRTYFTMPPQNPGEMEAYERGYANRDKPRGAGFSAKQLKQMLCHLGFDDGNGGIDPAANSPANWYRWGDGTPRFIQLTVQLGPKTAREGREVQYSEVKMFSYTDSELNGNPPDEFKPKTVQTQPRPSPSGQPKQQAAPTQQKPAQTQQRPTQTQQRPATSGQQKKPAKYDV